MWYVIKHKKNYLNSIKAEIKKKLGVSPEIYSPTIKYDKFFKDKKVEKQIRLLGNYALCFHQEFENQKIVNNLKFTRGLDYFLEDSVYCQKEIIEFVEKCKKHQDKQGYLNISFFDYCKDKTYKFINGPFSKLLFKIININKNKIEILLGNFRTTVTKKNNFFQVV
tara:strand:- start:497 stop:994 length:498 start_codon:yes stop_codon:yes gene_type:complete